MFVIIEHGSDEVPTLFEKILITRINLRIYYETVAYIHCNTTTSMRFKMPKLLALRETVARIACLSKKKMILLSMLWMRACTLKMTNHDRLRFDSSSNITEMVVLTLLIVKVLWNLVFHHQWTLVWHWKRVTNIFCWRNNFSHRGSEERGKD